MSAAWAFERAEDDVASNAHFPTERQTRVDSLTLYDRHNLFVAPIPTGENRLVMTYPRSLKVSIQLDVFPTLPDRKHVLFSDILQRVEDFNIQLFGTGRLQ